MNPLDRQHDAQYEVVPAPGEKPTPETAGGRIAAKAKPRKES